MSRTKEQMAGTVNDDMDNLNHRVRMMEVNRRTYHDESANIVRTQRQQIDKLKRDNERLKEDLALETRQAKQASNMTASAQIAKLQEQKDMYTHKIEQERKRIEELQTRIKEIEASIHLQRADMGGVNASRDKNRVLQKSIRILENKLDKALVKFNEALAHNKNLRETIDNLRRERVVFDGIYRKLEKELQEKKNRMALIIEASNGAYESRDKAQEEMVKLKEQADQEQKAFEKEWSKLAQMIENDRNMQDPTNDANMDATGTHEDMDPALLEEQKLRKRLAKSAWAIAKDKANIHISTDKVQDYEESFAKIQKATGIDNINELVQTFINAEDQNFSLFNYVNDLSNEIEKLEESIGGLKGELHKYKGQGASSDKQRKQILEDLEGKLTKTEQKSSLYGQKHSEAMSTVNALKDGISGIFEKIGCTTEGYSELLGSAGVTESNMMQYLGVIEQRTNELLATYHYQQNDSGLGASASVGAYQGGETVAATAAINVTAPALGDYDEESDDEDVMPMTAEEIEAMQAGNMVQQ